MKKHIVYIMLILSLLLSGCGTEEAEAPVLPDYTPAAEQAAPLPTESPAPDTAGEGAVCISELMIKNRSTLMSADGGFYDWIELENLTGEELDITGFQLSDKREKQGWSFPSCRIEPHGRILVFASGADGTGNELHADFSLSAGETLTLRNASGYELCAAELCECEADCSLCLNADGSFSESSLPTPAFPNTREGYDEYQSTLQTPQALIISEVLVDNRRFFRRTEGYYDIVELKNNSGRDIDLSDWYLSDDNGDLKVWRLPEKTLEAGEYYYLFCTGTDEPPKGETVDCAPFKLDSYKETLYLSTAGGVKDYVSLRNIPCGGSFGRLDGENGWFYFEEPSPGRHNSSGMRRVSAEPMCLSGCGIYENTDSVQVELYAEGDILYTTDGSDPKEFGEVYSSPFELTETAVVRTVCYEAGAFVSREADYSYFINEELTLPAVSLVAEDIGSFNHMYNEGMKELELPATLSYYGDDGSFSIGCGVKMNGATSLSLYKKNLSLRFRGSYGQEKLRYDLFGGGVTEFTNLLLRAGQDYYSAVIRNEFCQELCLAASDSVVTQRSKYCVLYVNGKYRGVYALKEKTNEQQYADLTGTPRESVLMEEAQLPVDSVFYNEVYLFCLGNDLRLEENYRTVCERLDTSSLIDWMILEGYCANTDLNFGNVRYVRSDANDGKWRLVFFDLDSTFTDYEQNFYNIFSERAVSLQQVSRLINSLIRNDDFRDRFLRRAGELFSTVLSNENALRILNSVVAEVEGEVLRDIKRIDRTADDWDYNISYLRRMFEQNDWCGQNIDILCSIFGLSEEQRAHYFGA